MNFTKNEFFFRIMAITGFGVAASLFNVISLSWWSAALCGLLFSLLFTLFSQRILSQHVFGKIGQGSFAWYGVHSALGLIGYIALLYLFAFTFSISVSSTWDFYAVAAAGYITVCQHSLREFFWLLPSVLEDCVEDYNALMQPIDCVSALRIVEAEILLAKGISPAPAEETHANDAAASADNQLRQARE